MMLAEVWAMRLAKVLAALGGIRRGRPRHSGILRATTEAEHG